MPDTKTTIAPNNTSSDVSFDALLSLGQPKQSWTLPITRLFLGKYGTYPNRFNCCDENSETFYHVTTILNCLQDEYKHDISKDCFQRNYDRITKQKYITCRLCDLGNGIMIHINNAKFNSDLQNPNGLKSDLDGNYFLTTTDIEILYLPEHQTSVQELANRFSTMTLLSFKSCTLSMVCRNKYGFYLTEIKIKKPLITELGLHYGQKMIPVHDKILKNLNKKESKGIVLLHGIPGSGKTHYIRYLIQEIKEKTLIYVPPDLAKEISSPTLLPFLMGYQDSILIIEDAENIIKDRNETTVPTQAVANLLNLSDGLLGDAMHQQIIATFNCDLKAVDPALLRKGRLIADYEFGKLDVESSKVLSDKLGFGSENISEPMTLAEIFNQDGKDNLMFD